MTGFKTLRRARVRRIAGSVSIAALLLSTAVVPAAQAALITTDQVTASETVAADRAKVTAFLAREDVRNELVKLGVEPGEALARVSSLTDAEVSRIAGRIDSMPAGQGAIGAIVGAAVLIFLVLLITDLLGLTKVFPFTRGPARH